MINKQHNDRLIVLSTGRTGTKFLSQVFSALDRGDISHQGRYSRIINIVGNLGLCGGFGASSRKFLLYILNKTDRMNSTADPLLSVPNTLLQDHHKEINGLKILHIIRDPRDFVTSFMNWRSQKLHRMFLHHCVPFWQPNPWCVGDASITTYFKMSKFEHFCWIWAFKNNLFETKWENSGAEYLRLRMEDVSAVPRSDGIGINNLASFLNISTSKLVDLWNHSPVVNQSIKKHFPNWRQWPKGRAIIFDKYCGPLMAKYGYGSEPEWQELIIKE